MTETTEHMHVEFHSRIGLPAMFYLHLFAHFFEVPLSFFFFLTNTLQMGCDCFSSFSTHLKGTPDVDVGIIVDFVLCN